eukprot:SAG31_NODE_1637_length_7679_cov_5.133509_5_plen_804_part_00
MHVRRHVSHTPAVRLRERQANVAMPLTRVATSREVTSIVVSAGTSWDVTVFAVAGARILNHFRTEIGDVTFECLFLPSATHEDNIYALSAHVSPLVVQKPIRCRQLQVEYEPDQHGVLLLRFDNQHSWARSKSCTIFTQIIAAPRHISAVATTSSNPNPTISLETKIEKWLSEIPIGSPGAEGACSPRTYDPQPIVEFARANCLESETGDEIYRLFVENLMEQAEAKMAAMGIEPPVEVDVDLRQIGKYCMGLDDDSLQIAKTRRQLEAKLRRALEAHSTFLVGVFHDVCWDWASGRFNEVPEVSQIHHIGAACTEWAESRHRGKITVERVQARLEKAEETRRLVKEAALKEEANLNVCASGPQSDVSTQDTGYGGIFVENTTRIEESRRRTDFGDAHLESDKKDADVHAAATIDVRAGSSRDLTITIDSVSAGGTMIEWRFCVDNEHHKTSTAGWIYGLGETKAQIGHCAFYVAGVHDARSLYDAESVQAVDEVAGKCCKRVRALHVRLRGTLLLRFDNTAAWIGTTRVFVEWLIRQMDTDASPDGSPRTPQQQIPPNSINTATANYEDVSAEDYAGVHHNMQRRQHSPGIEDTAVNTASPQLALPPNELNMDIQPLASSKSNDMPMVHCIEPLKSSCGQTVSARPDICCIQPQLLGRKYHARWQSSPGDKKHLSIDSISSSGWWTDWRRQIRIAAGSSQDIAVPMMLGKGSQTSHVTLEWKWAGLESTDSICFSAVLLRIDCGHPLWNVVNICELQHYCEDDINLRTQPEHMERKVEAKRLFDHLMLQIYKASCHAKVLPK